MYEKVKAVEAAFETLDKEVAEFQTWSLLSCKPGCGKCCFKPSIEATVLEFLPFAYYAYLQNTAFEWLEKIKSAPSTICVILDPGLLGTGLCSAYKHRGLICRLFGFSARTNKYGKKELVTCQIIKEEQNEKFQQSVEGIDSSLAVPVMGQHYMRLHAIDHELTREFFPINEAIKRALEVILHYHAYRS